MLKIIREEERINQSVDTTMNENLRKNSFWTSAAGQVLRWILVPFAAVVGSYVVYLTITLLCGLQNIGYAFYVGQPVTSVSKVLLYLACQGITGYVFVLCGAYTAPKYRKNTGIVLATIGAVACVVSVVFAIIQGLGLLTIGGTLCTMVGAVYSAYNISQEESDIA